MAEPTDITESGAARAPRVARATRGEARVEQRDFGRPLRLSAARAQELTEAVRRSLPALAGGLADTLGRGQRLELKELGEVGAEGLFRGLAAPLVVLRFDVRGQPGWLLWDSVAAVTAIETAMGSAPAAPAARTLTRVEANVLGSLLAGIATSVGAATVGPASAFVLAQEPDDVGTWRDAAETPDPHRLHVELELDGSGGPSRMHLYLPGLRGGAAGHARDRADLPRHLDRVEVELSARLPGCTLPLEQLLALEEGDVIPIDARVGDPLIASVEGKNVALATWGTRRGRMVIRIDRFLEED